jgi:hypothetical protein
MSIVYVHSFAEPKLKITLFKSAYNPIEESAADRHEYPIHLLPGIQRFHTGRVRNEQSSYKCPAGGVGPRLRLSAVYLEWPVRVLRHWNRQWRHLHQRRCDGLVKEQPKGTGVLNARMA